MDVELNHYIYTHVQEIPQQNCLGGIFDHSIVADIIIFMQNDVMKI